MSLILKFFPGLKEYILAIEVAAWVALFVAGIGLGWHLHSNADAAATLKGQQHAVMAGNAQNARDAASARQHEAKRQAMEQQDNQVKEKLAAAAAAPSYTTCRLKPADLDLLNQAITGGDHGIR